MMRVNWAQVCFVSIFFTNIISLSSQTATDSFSLKSDFQSKPSFYEESSPYLVNREGYVYIGQTINSDQVGIYFYDVRNKKKIFVPVPVREYFLEHPSLLQPGTSELKEDVLPVILNNLLYYDVSLGKAGLFIEHSHYKLPSKKYYFMSWDLSSNQIEFAEEIYEKKGSDKSSFSLAFPIGFNSSSVEGYFAFSVDSDIKNKSAKDIEVRIFKYTKNKIESIHRYQTERFPYNIVYHEPSGKVLLQSYVESHEGVSPEGYLLDLSSSESIPVSIPTVPYGACFSKDGSKFYIVSSDTGESRVYETNTGKVIQKSKWGTHGHTMGFWKENEIVWVRNSGIHIYDSISMKAKKTIPTKNYYKGQINVSGSVVIPGYGILLRNGFEGPDGAAGFRLLLSSP